MLWFKEELQKINQKVEDWENITVARYWDGEKMLMSWQTVWENTQARRQDKWMSKWMTLLWEDLLKTLDIVDDRYIYAIPCKCCNQQVKQRYIDNLKTKNYSFANIFINWNYQTFKRRMENTKKTFNLIVNHEWLNKKYPFNTKEIYTVGDDCVNFYKDNKEKIIKEIRKKAKNSSNEIFLISAWPLANIFVYEMFKTNPNNTYLDVWSALDEYTKQKITRWFQRPWDFYSQRICQF